MSDQKVLRLIAKLKNIEISIIKYVKTRRNE